MNTNTNHRILIVDDDSEIRQLLKQYLSEAGYTVEGVANGVEMHNWLRRKTASLIILDVMLPGDDGLTLCSEIQSSTRTPVILLTALGSPIDRVVGLD
ncbi:MAG: response regulator, partial [Oxalicibacterium faecigallinarum]|uniref:response regulator n=1 Tax=Oxalicibacterium faecigallinarum TaxID=573741 RepID=UPI0028071D55